MRPPLQPLLPQASLQSIKFCSESDTSFPVLRKCCPSRDPVVLNDQQEPHLPCRKKYRRFVMKKNFLKKNIFGELNKHIAGGVDF